jgi:Flp pilus assembly protein TadG
MIAPAFLIRRARMLGRDTSGTALLEFAFMLPILLTMSLTGAELTNYIITRMRISQMALHLADNAARIGSGSQLQAKTISEADINDLFTGAQLQSGELDLKSNGRVILSDVEPTASGASTYKLGWQRCYGSKSYYVPVYPPANADKSNLPGIGPAGRQTIAPDGGVAMFVEVYYEYKPLVKTSLSPSTTMVEIASMMVRDRRDTSDDSKNADGTTNPNPLHPNGVYKVAGVTPSTC